MAGTAVVAVNRFGGAAPMHLWARHGHPLELAPARTLYVVNRVHENYYAPILSDETAENLVVQPSNRGTAPAILFSLLRIAARDPKAVVAFFPSDHYVSDNAKFMAGSKK